MKKLWKKTAAFILAGAAAVSTLAFAACESGEVVNAYDIAVKNGFEGDEQAWLEWLRGKDGADGQDLTIEAMYEAAKNSEEGYEGTLLDFMKELGLSFTVQEDNATEIIAENTSSVVGVCCAFEKEVIVGNRITSRKEKLVSAAEGSGVIFKLRENDTTATAYIVTNYHVVYDSEYNTGISNCIYVYPYGAREGFTKGDDTDGDGYIETEAGDFTGDGIKASYVGGAMDYDIAILKVDSSEYLKNCAASEAKFGDSDALTIGEKAFAIGNANGLGISVTSGVVSVDSENIAMTSTDGNRTVSYRVLRTDAAINHGNSGGGLFNAQGELIGITNAKSVADETDNMGYALPITQVRYLMDNILANAVNDENGYALRAWLGVEAYIDASTAALVNNKLTITEDVVISAVLSDEDAGAANGKLKVGDKLISITLGGKETPLMRRYQLNDLLLTVRKGDTMTLKVLRDGEEKQVDILFDKDEYFVKYE